MIETPDQLFAAWELQQTAYVERRQSRTEFVVAALSGVASMAEARGDRLRVVDIGCGPGSLSKAILSRYPEAEVVGVDRDPVLLRLARETSSITLVDADLTDNWVSQLPGGDFDAVVSATALHWLDPNHLVDLYLKLPQVLRTGGVFLNCDHLFFSKIAQPYLSQVASDRREVSTSRLAELGALDWEAWWSVALAMPGWEVEATAHRQRWETKHATRPVSVEFHLAALQAAGFVETAQVWQWFDDRVIFGRLP